MILVRSRGAMTVLATAPAKAPHSRDSSALDLGLKSCLDTKTRLISARLWMLSHVIVTNGDPWDNAAYLYDLTRNDCAHVFKIHCAQKSLLIFSKDMLWFEELMWVCATKWRVWLNSFLSTISKKITMARLRGSGAVWVGACVRSRVDTHVSIHLAASKSWTQ